MSFARARHWSLATLLGVVALAVLLLAAPGAAIAASGSLPYSATIADAQAAAQELLTATGAPSMSVAIMSGDRVVWAQGFGCADLATKAAPTTDTMFGIGSVSKMLATVAVMRLVDQGKVSLDTPLVRYVPSFRMASADYPKITVRMLLNHSSGLPGSSYGDLITSPDLYPGYLDEVLRTLAVSRLKAAPGAWSVYCNDGFTLVEALIQSVSGKSYARFVQDEVFGPLGMTHSTYPTAPFADGTYAKSYTGDEANPREALNMLGSGGVYSTPTDLGRLASMLVSDGVYRGRRFLSKSSVQAMGTDQTVGQFNPLPTDLIRYGLGWDTVSQAGLKQVGAVAWFKGGDSPDYHAAFLVLPDKDLAVCVAGVAPLSSGTLEAYAERIALNALVESGRLAGLPDAFVENTQRVRATQSQLSAMEGYWAGSGEVLHIQHSSADPQALDISQLVGGQWTAKMQGLTLRRDGYFRDSSGSGGRFRTLSAAGNNYLVFNFLSSSGTYRQSVLFAQKLTAQPSLSAAWQGRVGQSWLAVSEVPSSLMWLIPRGPILSIRGIPGLRGYMVTEAAIYSPVPLKPVNDSLGGMFLQIPGAAARDLLEAAVIRRGGEDWIRFGDTVCRPLAGVRALATGANTVTFGLEGYAEWRTVPAGATLYLRGGKAWRLYDLSFNSISGGTGFPATVTAPAGGSYLLVFGAARSTARITAVVPVGAGALSADPVDAATAGLRAALEARSPADPLLR